MQSISAQHDKIEGIMTHEFIIPEFQRPYSWDARKCLRLFFDLTSAFRDRPEEKYFLGNIIYYPEPKSDNDVWYIVDGQQRLITLMMFIRALYAKKGDDKYLPLKRMIYKVGDYDILDELRLNSLVIPEGTYGPDDMKKILSIRQETDEMLPRNPFKLNYECLEKALDEWWVDNDEKLDAFVKFLRRDVILLPIRCEGLDDALSLFETINDRGMQLNDSDIFKAKIYGAIDGEKEKLGFIEQWGELKKHVMLFRAYMHALKAKEEIETNRSTAQRTRLRTYIIEHCLGNRANLKTTWGGIMDSVEKCHLFYTRGINWDEDKKSESKAKIYWRILLEYPNESWRYPLFVFVHKHAELQNGELVMHADRRTDFLNLLKSTVRFFFIKGVVHNSIDKVRDTIHKISVLIEKESPHPSYANQENTLFVEEGELKLLETKLKNIPNLGGYRDGLVFLSSFLNENQNPSIYSDNICSPVHIEHILPKNKRAVRGHYAQWGWKEKSHKELLEKIGNLMPLEPRKNTRASDYSFNIKQEEYKNSGVADAVDLSNQPAHWSPKDLENRHDEAVTRLMKFFKS